MAPLQVRELERRRRRLVRRPASEAASEAAALRSGRLDARQAYLWQRRCGWRRLRAKIPAAGRSGRACASGYEQTTGAAAPVTGNRKLYSIVGFIMSIR